jgi:threonine dehydrogenase-like Zn-dependent dehydrogenase
VSLLDVDSGRLQAIGDMLGVRTIQGGVDAPETVQSLTNGLGFDVVFDATGNTRSMETSFDFVAPGGRYVFVGVVTDPITFRDPDFHRKEMSLFASRNALATDFERVTAAIRDGLVPISRIVTHRTSLADAARDLPHWATNKEGLVKAVIEI